MLTTLAVLALIALVLFVFMLVKGFPHSVDTNEAAKEDRFDLRSLELRRDLAKARAENRALLAPKHPSKKHAVQVR